MKIRILLNLSTLLLTFILVGISHAGPYLTSAHGDASFGVDRPSMKGTSATNYAVGNCAHCHEQHASLEGSEPAPVNGGPANYMLFDTSNSSQTVNFCFDCHGTGTYYQNGGHVTNRSFSFRAGGWAADPISDIQSDINQASSHNLADIVTFVSALAQGWVYTANSNACAVCHDPHLVQGDPLDDSLNGSSTKITGPGRGVAITRVRLTTAPAVLMPSTMNVYAGANPYLAPDCVTATSSEPECNATSNGTNMWDYVTFCTDCHDNTKTTFGSQTLKIIDWSNGVNGEKHGQVSADVDVQMTGPYASGATTGYVLSCLDCHEPHGSANIYLLRGKVNGGVTTSANLLYTTDINTGLQFDQLCSQCHNPQPVAPGTGVNWEDVHHDPSNPGYLLGLDEPYDYTAAPYQADCTNGGSGYCHTLNPPSAQNKINCMQCHYHGAATGGAIPVPNSGAPSPLYTF